MAIPSRWAAAKPRTIGEILIGAGVLVLCGLVFEFGISAVMAQESQDGLLPVFKAAAQTTVLDDPAVNPAPGSPVALLSIPRLGLRQVVVEGSSPEELKAGPGHLSVSPMPGEFGNAVLLGRRTTYGAPFRDLNRMRKGDHVSVITGQGTFTYLVSQVGRVSTGDVAPLQGTLDSRLTLVTSDPTYLFSGRLVVVAMLRGDPLAVARRNPPGITALDLGLASDPVWLAPAALAGQLLALTIWLTVRMRRRWPVSVTYMFAGPVIAALTVLVITTIDRGLPGTL
jgi:sortase A